MHEHQEKAIAQKFKTDNAEKDLLESLHIHNNLNIALIEYFIERGSYKNTRVKYWIDKQTEFLNKLKIQEDESKKSD